jgi:hypothetical protein
MPANKSNPATNAPATKSFPDLTALSKHLRDELNEKKFVLLYAYNGTGKTRISADFKELGKKYDADRKVIERDTLYFNAYTEDLFTWDNDLDDDERRVLHLNAKSTFFDGLGEFEIENRVRKLLNLYADFGFQMDLVYRAPTKDEERPRLEDGRVSFSRDVLEGEGASQRLVTKEHIKISRGEERLFVWCFFLAIIEIAVDPETDAYSWVKYIYVDDPMSSLDEQNVVMVATHLAKILKDSGDSPRVVISTHHPLFHNVLWNELKKNSRRYFVAIDRTSAAYLVRNTEATPFFHHIAALIELYEIDRTGTLNTYHFNTLRAIAEKTASFLGYGNFADCIRREADDLEGRLHTRLLNLLSHGGYSVFEPTALQEDNRDEFGPMLHRFIRQHAFDERHFPDLPDPTKEK